MAVTGLVQRMTVNQGPQGCALIGPSPTNTQAFFFTLPDRATPTDIAFVGGVIDMLTSAMTNRQEVTVEHTDSRITSVVLGS
ncbi:MAG TPA: hypothetical protein VHJ17_26285 [Thermomonospora sp.]|nr:hypothetical protein [Thermomonospora sp.]